MSRHAETKDSILKKWWFWLILLIIVIIIAFVVIMWRAFSIVLDEIGTLAIDIQNVYEDATVYTSAGGNTIVIELRNWDNDYSDKLNEIIDIVKAKIDKGELSQYSKLITLAYLTGSETEDLLIIHTHNMPDFTEAEETKQYIAFSEYQGLYNNYEDSMQLLDSIFND